MAPINRLPSQISEYIRVPEPTFLWEGQAWEEEKKEFGSLFLATDDYDAD